MDDYPRLGPCCNCGNDTAGTAGVIVMIDRRSPTPGRGWGCVQCGLPCDGAIAVLCDDCADVLPPKFVCTGYPGSDGRTPYEDLPLDVFDHDPAKHPEGDYNDFAA